VNLESFATSCSVILLLLCGVVFGSWGIDLFDAAAKSQSFHDFFWGVVCFFIGGLCVFFSVMLIGADYD